MPRSARPSGSLGGARVLVVAWVASAGAGVLLVHGYLANRGAVFYVGLFGLAAALGGVSFLLARRGRVRSVLVLNTVVCLLIGVSLVDGYGAWRRARADSRPVEPVYTVSAAKADPSGFERWWKVANARFRGRQDDLMIPDPLGTTPAVLKPGARVANNEAEIRINALGFRGPEIIRTKGDRFRIVVLGESTTFGLTLLANDRPWPEVLQDRIEQELSCDTEVQVVNAGIPGWTLANNLARLDRQILPLAPDLLISYHGYNGFQVGLSEIPEMTVRHAPARPERPSWLLQRAEMALRLGVFRWRYEARDDRSERELQDWFASSRYATNYISLIREARQHGVELVLCSFNLAIDQDSPEQAVRFYERGFPKARADVLANRLHTRMLRGLGSLPEARFVDATPGLDGEYERYFVDLVHFNQAERERLARNVLAGIRPILISHPRARCRPRAPTGG